ncbi:hypothetical protein PIB30_012055 [Stylosanthes scabra]|nr:hypothetical protein [Stylosanthes scabra]
MQTIPGRRRRTPNDSEDDGREGVKRMRGLEDLGIGIVSKRKGPSTSTPDMLQQDSTAHNSSNTGSCLVNGTIVNGVKSHYSTLKRKRSQVTTIHESLKRKSRRRQLTKVLETTAMVSVPVTCDQLPTSSSSLICAVPDGKTKRLDSNDSKKSSLQTINNSNSNEAACVNGSSLNIQDKGCEASEIGDIVKEEAPGTSHKFLRDVGNEKHTADFSPTLASCSSGKPEDGVLGQQSSQLCQSEVPSLRNGSHRTEKGSSKWQSKGKRNLRNTSKNRKGGPRKHVNMDNESSNYQAGMPNSDGVSQGAGPKAEGSIGGGASASNNLTTQSWSKQVVEGQLDGFEDLGKHDMGATEMKPLPNELLTPQKSLPHRQSRLPGKDLSSDALLFDVKLEVKSSYRPQHVPLVSLASKLNGKAFIGHPVTVEVLDNGHCDTLLRGIRHDSEARDGYCMVRPNSTTRRKPSKKLSRYSKSSKTKKKPSLLNKKIRRLSSLTGHRQSEEKQKAMADKAKGPVISCIPLKVVFSRISEAVSVQVQSSKP